MAKEQEVIDVGEVPEDQQVIVSDGATLTSFLGGFAAFFSQATELEDAAGALELKSRTWANPKTAEEDAALVRNIQAATAAKKSIVTHWEITSAFSRLHKRLVAVRERGVAKAELAASRAQTYHNYYLQAEKRRVQEENDRREREAEERARMQREAELRALEEKRVEAEETAPELSAREQAFVRYFREGKAGRVAAQLAGYKDPVAQAARLQTSEKIRAAIRAADEADALRRQAAAKAAQPLDVAPVERAVVNVIKTGSERSYKGAELLDGVALQTAFLGCAPRDFQNKYGIPADVFTVDESKLNQYGRDLGVLINRWPGVRFTDKKKTI